MQQIYDEVQSLNGEILLIGPETEENALKLMEKTHASIPLLYDLDGSVQDSFNLAFELPEIVQGAYMAGPIGDLAQQNPKTGWRLPIPATFVLDSASKVRARFVNPNHTFRMEPADVLAAVKEVAGS